MTRRPAVTLGLLIVGYVALFSFYCYRRHWCYMEGDWDLGTFEQSFYTAARLGLPFYNTYEGVSHFGFHNSPIFLLILPIYSLLPYTMTLLVLQSLALALAAIPVYLLGRDLIGPRAGLVFAVLYLLNFPMHGVNYHDFHETSWVVAPFLLALWGLRTGRRVWLWTGNLLALMGREDMGIMLAGMGLLGLYWRSGRGVQPLDPERRTPPALGDCIAMVVLGLAYTAFSVKIVMPAYGGAHVLAADHFSRFAHLGDGPLAWALSPVTHPQVFWGRILGWVGISYMLGLIGPLAFLPLLAWPTLLVMAPQLALNLESSFPMYLYTSHYAGPLIPFVFCAGVEGAAIVVNRRVQETDQDVRDTVAMRVLRPAMALTILLMLLFDPSPLHIGRRPRPITDHARIIDSVCSSIPPDAAVSAAPNMWTHLTHRLLAFPFFDERAEYIVFDEAQPQFYHEAHFDVSLPPVLASGRYVLVRSEDSPPDAAEKWAVRLYRRVEHKL